MENINFLKAFIIILILSINSCSSIKKNDLKKKMKFDDEVEVIKFMGTITTQSRSIDEKAFWYFKKEHARLLISDSGFIDYVKTIKNNNFEYFDEYKYAFIVKKGKAIDTLYSDKTLKTWLLKKRNEKIYFYDENNIIGDNLRNSFSFFYDCW